MGRFLDDENQEDLTEAVQDDEVNECAVKLESIDTVRNVPNIRGDECEHRRRL